MNLFILLAYDLKGRGFEKKYYTANFERSNQLARQFEPQIIKQNVQYTEDSDLPPDLLSFKEQNYLVKNTEHDILEIKST